MIQVRFSQDHSGCGVETRLNKNKGEGKKTKKHIAIYFLDWNMVNFHNVPQVLVENVFFSHSIVNIHSLDQNYSYGAQIFCILAKFLAV